MNEKMDFLFLGIGTLVAGVVLLVGYKGLARRAAEQMKDSSYARWFRFDYSEEYFQGLYIFGGSLLVLAGILFFIKVLAGEPGSILYLIESYLAGILVVVAFGGGLVYIIYSNWRFGIRRKK